ncbi:unnamed protein product [Pleuronectes platessa]|uniref:Uncharacterized protein n=1 Tax=Pleuronectes platessa TaxID=8262 RepID=A0A9N7U6I9_PLEPL|nr:unnamed protein product [Pleuronectes platessa]
MSVIVGADAAEEERRGRSEREMELDEVMLPNSEPAAPHESQFPTTEMSSVHIQEAGVRTESVELRPVSASLLLQTSDATATGLRWVRDQKCTESTCTTETVSCYKYSEEPEERGLRFNSQSASVQRRRGQVDQRPMGELVYL